MSNYDDVLRTAQALNEPERARLVEALLISLSPQHAAPLDDLWLAEIERRSIEIDSGAVETIPWNEVRTAARNRVKFGG